MIHSMKVNLRVYTLHPTTTEESCHNKWLYHRQGLGPLGGIHVGNSDMRTVGIRKQGEEW